ncbi:glycosyltransferase family 4 protein [Planctomycetota bacterium]
MKVIWLTNCLMPDHARALGASISHRGGWLPALARELVADQRVELAVATTAPVTCTGKITDNGIHYYGVPHRRVVHAGRNLPRWLIKGYQDIIQDFQPDVIHIHGTEYFHGLLTKEDQISCPAVVSIQGIIDVCQHHWYGGLSPDVLNAKRTLRDRMRRDGLGEQKQKLVKRAAVEREIFSHNSNFIGRTEWDRQQTARLNPTANYYHCDELLRTPFYGATWQFECSQRYTLFTSGASYPLKGFHVLVKALNLLRPDFPGISVRVLLSHVYPRASGWQRIWKTCRSRGYARYLTDLIRKEGLTDHIVTLPPLDAQGVVEELKRAHLFVLPSFMENSSNALSEAMMVGTPSVVSKVGGIPSLACHEESALMFPAGDEVQLAEQIRRLFLDEAYAQQLSSKAQVIAQERHAVLKIVNTMLDIYHGVASKVSREAVNR